MNTLALLTFFSFFIIAVNSFGQNYWKIKEHLQRQSYDKQQRERNQRMKLHGQPSLWLQAIDREYYITQPMDHFDAENQDTYEQRFWVNDQFFTSSKGPVFLYIGGEGPLNALAVQEGEHVVLAKKYGALLFAVEHRFYGASINDDGLELKNLRFLSSQQALADLASFHAFASDKYNLTEDNRWISFGGSYPGALSAWFRLKYPHLVHAAVASSAPVNTVVNFEGYNEVVTSSLSDPLVNGSLKCVLHVKEAFKTLDMKLQKLDYASVAQDFKSCKPLTDKLDVFQLVSNLADIFMSSVQYDGDGPSYSISNVCAMMAKPGDPYDNLVNVNQVFLKNSMTNCSDNSWKEYVEHLKNTSVDKLDPFVRSDRQWLYQTCSQFGYYQTCGVNTTCPFSRYMDLWPNLELCRSAYNIDPDLVYKRVDFTNAYYGAGHIKGTRIVFVNGSIDPWHALGILNSLSASEIAVFINGTSHCADLELERQRDTLALRNARQQIDKQLGMWLTEDS